MCIRDRKPLATSAPTITPVRLAAPKTTSGVLRASTPMRTDMSTDRAVIEPDSDVGALRQSLLARLPELRTTRPPDSDVERMFTDLMSRRDLLAGPGAPPSDALHNMLEFGIDKKWTLVYNDLCLLYTSPSPRDLSTSRMPSSA